MSDFDVTNFMNNIGVNNGRTYAILRLFVNAENNDLKTVYQKHINKHNNEVINSIFPNAGFDLFVPSDVIFNKEIESKFIDLEIHCEMLNNDNQPQGFFLFPRSSISKTPIMLANHTGIIDSGYRGRMIGAFRWLKSSEQHETCYTIEKGTRLLQICHPSLCPILIHMVDSIDDLSTTERGAGGFGSTGR
jgi:dUTP pyrophosphatase